MAAVAEELDVEDAEEGQDASDESLAKGRWVAEQGKLDGLGQGCLAMTTHCHEGVGDDTTWWVGVEHDVVRRKVMLDGLLAVQRVTSGRLTPSRKRQPSHDPHMKISGR